MSLNCLAFNQDASYLAVGTSTGLRIFTTDPLSVTYEAADRTPSMLEMLFSTSLIASVFSPRRLQIANTKRLTTICELTFPRAILAVRMNRKRLMVLLEHHIYLYDIQTMKLLYTIDTSPNPQAICALASSSDNCYLAYPLPQAAPSAADLPQHVPPGKSHIHTTTGDVLIFDTVKLDAVNVICAHRSPLSCMTFNASGTLLATASDKGTIVRVFSVPAGQKLHQFRRGSMPTRISSMAFNPSSSLLCVSSATDTIHVFKLQSPPGYWSPTDDHDMLGSDLHRAYSTDSNVSDTSASLSPHEVSSSSTDIASRRHNGTLIGMLRRTSQNVGSSLATKVGGYLPRGVAEMWEPERDFAWLKLPKVDPAAAAEAAEDVAEGGPTTVQPPAVMGEMVKPVRTVVAMNSDFQIMVATGEGHFYVYDIDMVKGGEGTLVRQYDHVLAQSSRGTR